MARMIKHAEKVNRVDNLILKKRKKKGKSIFASQHSKSYWKTYK